MLFAERLLKLGDQRVKGEILDNAQCVEWYSSDQSLWIRYKDYRPDRPLKDVPEEEIRAFMVKFPRFRMTERRTGFVPDRRIIEWTRT